MAENMSYYFYKPVENSSEKIEIFNEGHVRTCADGHSLVKGLEGIFVSEKSLNLVIAYTPVIMRSDMNQFEKEHDGKFIPLSVWKQINSCLGGGFKLSLVK